MNVSEFRRLIAAELAEVHTCLPGVIVSYDGSFAVVRPALDKQLANGETLPAPKIVRVPVCWPCGDVGGAKALISVPLRPGDPVLLTFSERGIDEWLGGQDGAPGDPRQFDLSDCFASPMLRPANALRADTTNVSIQFGPGSIKISPEGKITIVAPGGLEIVAPTMTSSGSVSLPGNVTIGGIQFNTHRHPPDTSGPANP